MMTNEEKINLRERALRLSNELPNPIPQRDSEMLWAEEVYRYLSKDLDDDPLKLDMPSPVWRHESEMSAEEYWRLHSKMHGINWSRPQLVQWIGDTLILQTNGTHGTASMKYPNGWFGGTVVNEKWGSWKKGENGEWEKNKFVYHGEIPQEQPAEGKTTSLNFLEAMTAAARGCVVNRNSECRNYGPYKLYEKRIRVDCKSGYTALFDIDDFLATDWQIIEP